MSELKFSSDKSKSEFTRICPSCGDLMLIEFQCDHTKVQMELKEKTEEALKFLDKWK